MGGDEQETTTAEAAEAGRVLMQIEDVARLCHEVNRAYCASIGDQSQPAWADSPEWQRSSAIAGVKFHLSGKRTPQESHQAWMKQKADEGWKYGPVKNTDLKEHPAFLPYEELPLEQRTKDYLFAAVVETCQPLVVEG